MGASESKPQVDFDNLDLYAVLELSEEATVEEVKRAYRKKALEHHPDKNQNDVQGATKRFNRVLEAYETLSDSNKRSAYNYTRAFNFESEPSTTPQPQSSGPPGAWNEEPAETAGSKQTWFEWVFGSQTATRYQRAAFNPEKYAAAHQYRGSGIGFNDIAAFVESLQPTLDFSSNLRGDKSHFKIIEDFFMCLAHDERMWHTTHAHRRLVYPRFGSIQSVWTRDDWDWVEGDTIPHEVDEFYSFWSTFKTLKSFEWITPYTCDAYSSPRLERFCRKENKPYQEREKASYNEFIQHIVKALRNADPRYHTHLNIQEQRHSAQRRSTPAASTPSNNSRQAKKDRKKNKKKNKNKTTW
ncbi:hypothetical protein C8J57DRAFT_1335105 [Mycena rebaudengoi]|nr:hypothetical protein C8J57DRAFT_1335105 [Mycena rebaudengoi]